MEPSTGKIYGLIALSYLVAMVLTIIPLPGWVVWVRPQWVLMVTVFWVLRMPHYVGVGIAWLVGCVIDLLTGSLLGQHAFVFAIVAYLLIKFHSRLRSLPIWQQTIMVFVLLMFNLSMQFWLMNLSGTLPASWLYWLSALTSSIIWPWAYLILCEYELRFHLTG